jgi:hypothetical protein
MYPSHLRYLFTSTHCILIDLPFIPLLDGKKPSAPVDEEVSTLSLTSLFLLSTPPFFFSFLSSSCFFYFILLLWY